MKSKKQSKIFLIPIAIVVIAISITLYILFNPLSSNGDVRLNLFEGRWIENNKNKIINVEIPNTIPLYSEDGTGIIFSFLDYFQKETELDFNKMSYNLVINNKDTENQFRILSSDTKLGSNDLLFYSDNYVVVSKTSQTQIPIDQIDGKIGVLGTDFSVVSSYLAADKLAITKVATIAELKTMLDSGEVSYIIIPRNLYSDVILTNNYCVVNTLNDLSLKYVLTLGNNDNNLNNIIKKYYSAWLDNYFVDEYNKESFSLFTTTKLIDDKSKTNFMSKRYVYGYVDSLPYEVSINNDLSGISGEYLDSFAKFSGIEFNYKRYKSVTELNAAIKNNEVDIALNYYDFNSLDTLKTSDVLYSNYVIITKNDDTIIDTIKALPDTTAYIIKDTKLDNYIATNGSFNLKEVDKASDLVGRDIVIVDYNTYAFYRETYFKKYSISYIGKMNENYGYLVSKSESDKLFYNAFNYFLSTINHEQYKNEGINKMTNKTIDLDLSLLWLYVILIPIVAVIAFAISKKRKKIQKLRNDVKLKYIDPLTSLKNRYYLNNNIAKWEENNIYPQAIVVINLNNLKDVNDAYGHEGGDQLIKTAANIIINNQLEKTDIVRTDGNEFIIYMVGYEENAVVAYIRKMYKLLKELPYEYGASLGFSMIEDDIKTVEDAINEAILDMVTNRETKRNNDL